jgi:NADPH:quinone reductase-like Zn-dependent oxidoreductase/acyl carrier protein
MMQMPSGGPNGFGLECSGRITAVGDGVTEFQVGDRVYSLARPTFSPYVTGSVAYTAHIPDSMSFEDAATIPVAMLTAYFSLVTMGRLKRGEKVLIHAAAGGVGLAAVQVAQWLGAEIYATAGNEEKREYLRSLGIEHVMDSRSLSFADEVMKRTAGRGVDAVLNSLGGEFIHKGLEVLAPFGRFLEIGKRDIIGNTQLGLRPFEKGLTFYAIDIGPRDTADMRGAFQELAVHVADGTLGPIRKTVFPIDEAAAAFELMSRARHIGKIVVSLEKEPLRRMIAASAGERRDESSVSALGGRAGRSAVSSLTGSAASPSMSDRYRKGLVAEGLQPAEGAEAFMRLLGKPLSQVAITPRDLIGLVARGPMLQGAELAVADREAAPQPAYARPEIGTEFTAPGSETEVIIAGVWRQVLGIAEVGIYDDFYELGGDSLLATQVVARLREAFQMEIAVAKMFEEPTIAGLAAFIEETRWSAMGEADVEGERDEGRI